MRTEWRRNALRALLLLGSIGILLFPVLQGREQMPEKDAHKEAGSVGRDTLEAEASEKRAEEMFQLSEVLGSCVRIQANGHYGSGSILEMDENKITIVTNRHVLQYWEKDSYVTFFNGAVGNGEVAALSNQADVGFLSIYTAGLLPEELNGLSAIEISDVCPERGEWFFMADLASDVWNPVFYQGQVLDSFKYLEEFDTEMLYGDSAFQAGMSGCGVFNMGGKYIGMLTGGTDQNEIAAVPAGMVIDIYNEIKK